MKTNVEIKTILAILVLCVAGSVIEAGDSEFVFVAQPVGNTAVIDKISTNNKADAILIVTPIWNPGGARNGIYNNHNIGVYYLPRRGRWAIFNQDRNNMPVNASFNVMVRPPSPSAFVHRATPSNISGNYTTIDNDMANHNANAILLVTPNWNPGVESGVYNDHPVGVFYIPSQGKWAIFNEDREAMPGNAAFNVVVLSAHVAADYGESVFIHNATAINIINNYSTIDHPGSNHKGNALVFITHNWGTNGIYDSHPTGIFYSGDQRGGHWAVFNQDMAGMPVGVNFNVFVRWPGPD